MIKGIWTYSEKFKKGLVAAIEKGNISVEEARRKYGIGGKMTVSKWQKKYGYLEVRKTEISNMPRKKTKEPLQARIDELERELYLYQTLVTRSDYFRDPAVKKKIGQELSDFLETKRQEKEQRAIPLQKSVQHLELVGKATTNITREPKEEKNRKSK
jgi:transposase-like protein